VFDAAPGDVRGDLESADLVWVGFMVVAAIRVQVLRAPWWLPAVAADRWDSLDQRDELGYVVAVAAGGNRGQRDGVRVDDDMVLAAGLAPVRGGGAGGRPALHRPDVTGVDRGTGEIRQGGAQLGQQQLVQLLPDAGLVPVPQPPSAGHPRAEAGFLWEELPANPRAERDQDPAQNRARIQPLTARMPGWRGTVGSSGSMRAHSPPPVSHGLAALLLVSAGSPPLRPLSARTGTLSLPATRKPDFRGSAKLISGGARCLVMSCGAIRPVVL